MENDLLLDDEDLDILSISEPSDDDLLEIERQGLDKADLDNAFNAVSDSMSINLSKDEALHVLKSSVDSSILRAASRFLIDEYDIESKELDIENNLDFVGKNDVLENKQTIKDMLSDAFGSIDNLLDSEENLELTINLLSHGLVYLQQFKDKLGSSAYINYDLEDMTDDLINSMASGLSFEKSLFEYLNVSDWALKEFIFPSDKNYADMFL